MVNTKIPVFKICTFVIRLHLVEDVTFTEPKTIPFDLTSPNLGITVHFLLLNAYLICRQCTFPS